MRYLNTVFKIVTSALTSAWTTLTNPEPAEQNPNDPKKKKRDKVRSAWISFAGRIVAQLVGAIATVALGVMVLHRYTSGDARPGHPNAAAALGAPPPATEQRQDAYARPAASAPAHLPCTSSS